MLQKKQSHYLKKEKIEPVLPDVKNPVEDLIKCIKGEKEPETSFDVIEKTAFLSDEIFKNFL